MHFLTKQKYTVYHSNGELFSISSKYLFKHPRRPKNAKIQYSIETQIVNQRVRQIQYSFKWIIEQRGHHSLLISMLQDFHLSLESKRAT